MARSLRFLRWTVVVAALSGGLVYAYDLCTYSVRSCQSFSCYAPRILTYYSVACGTSNPPYRAGYYEQCEAVTALEEIEDLGVHTGYGTAPSFQLCSGNGQVIFTANCGRKKVGFDPVSQVCDVTVGPCGGVGAAGCLEQ
jgi:hypothetical protein